MSNTFLLKKAIKTTIKSEIHYCVPPTLCLFSSFLGVICLEQLFASTMMPIHGNFVASNWPQPMQCTKFFHTFYIGYLGAM